MKRTRKNPERRIMRNAGRTPHKDTHIRYVLILSSDFRSSEFIFATFFAYIFSLCFSLYISLSLSSFGRRMLSGETSSKFQEKAKINWNFFLFFWKFISIKNSLEDGGIAETMEEREEKNSLICSKVKRKRERKERKRKSGENRKGRGTD